MDAGPSTYDGGASMRRLALTIALLATGFASAAVQANGKSQSSTAGKGRSRVITGRTIPVVYDHSTGNFTCDGVTITDQLCQVRGSEGDIISVTVTSALPGLFQYNISGTQGTSAELPRQLAQSLGLISTQTATTSASTTATATTSKPSPPASEANVQSVLSHLGLNGKNRVKEFRE